MTMTGKQRRELAARGNRLRAIATIAGGEPTETAVESVRQALAAHDLIKVRISTDDRIECASTADQLASRVPCEIIKRIGRVVLLYRPSESEQGDTDSPTE